MERTGLIWGVLVASCTCCMQALAGSAFFLGNSLTNDIRLSSLEAMAALAGRTLETDFHIRSAASLEYIHANPLDFTRVKPAPFDVSLPAANYDFVSLQPFRSSSTLGSTSTLAGEVEASSRLIRLASGSPTILIHQSWPTLPEIADNFGNFWEAMVADVDAQQTIPKREFYGHFVGRLRAENPGRNVFLIPGGDVLARLDLEFRAGHFSGLTDVSDLFRDNVHLTRDLGAWVLSNTVLASMFGSSTEGLAVPPGHFSGINLSETELAQLQAIIWEEVSTNPLTVAAVPLPTPFTLFIPAFLFLLPILRRISAGHNVTCHPLPRGGSFQQHSFQTMVWRLDRDSSLI
jgi:hypothetical protein